MKEMLIKLVILAGLISAPVSGQTQLKVMTLNILQAGNATTIIGTTSPLSGLPRYQDIANVIIESGADIVGVTEENTSGSDPILAALQLDNPDWQKLGKVYAKFPILPDPLNPINDSRNSYAYQVEIGPDRYVYVHVAHWWPSNGYGIGVIQERIIDGTVPADLEVFEQEVLDQIDTPSTYSYTLGRAQAHIDAGRPVFLLGDFNTSSHLDWTAGYYANGIDRWVDNPANNTPINFEIEWRGSKALTDAGLTDAYREIWPDPVLKPGFTWTPPYANGTPGRRKFDGYTVADPRTQVQERIDWLMFSGSNMTVSAASVVGEDPSNPEHGGRSMIVPEIQYSGSWPSDHRGVLGVFTIPEDTGSLVDPSGFEMRHVDDFVSTIDQIEGNVDPVTLGDWSAAGTPVVQNIGAETLELVTPGTSGDHAYGTSGSDLDSAVGWTWETRFRIDSANETGPDGNAVWEIFMRDSDSQLSITRIQFYAAGIGRDTFSSGQNPEYLVDLTDGYHVVRGAIKAGTNLTSVWLDGTLIINAEVSNSYDADELIRVGEWSSNNAGGTTTIDYIRFDTSGAYAPPPIPQPPVIQSFAASSTNVLAGETVTLSWTTSGEDSLSLDQGIGDVTGLTATQIVVNTSTTYTLTASNDLGTVTESVAVAIKSELALFSSDFDVHTGVPTAGYVKDSSGSSMAGVTWVSDASVTAISDLTAITSGGGFVDQGVIYSNGDLLKLNYNLNHGSQQGYSLTFSTDISWNLSTLTVVARHSNDGALIDQAGVSDLTYTLSGGTLGAPVTALSSETYVFDPTPTVTTFKNVAFDLTGITIGPGTYTLAVSMDNLSDVGGAYAIYNGITLAAEVPRNPAAISISGPVSNGTSMVVSWMGESGATYSVETNSNLVAGEWDTFMSGITGANGSTITITNDIGLDQTFYRVISK